MKWPSSTNRGTALFKYLHQKEKTVLFRDNYIGWFVDEAAIGLMEESYTFVEQGDNPQNIFQRIAYWYTILRERFFDDMIENAIHAGYKQLLLLGAGFDTRSLRISILKEKGIPVVEIDMPATVETKTRILREKLGCLPENLSLISMDFNRDSIESVFHESLQNKLKTICIWQGLSYYLPMATVTNVLDSIMAALPTETLLGFDCCTPLMLKENDKIPGIKFNIDRLEKIVEPYLFGMYEEEMSALLKGKGFIDIGILKQNQLEERYIGKTTLPDDMWYVVSTRC